MGNKVPARKRSDEMPDQRDLEAADALLELSRGGDVILENHLPFRKRRMARIAGCESDDHSAKCGIEFGMDEKPKATANKRLNIRFVMNKSAEETNHKKRRAEEGDLSGDKDANPHEEDRELCDDQERIRSSPKKGKQSVEVRGVVQQEYFTMKHLENKMAEANWHRTSYAQNLIVPDQNDISDTSSPMLIGRPISLKKNLSDGFKQSLSDAAPVGEVEPLLKPTKKRISTSITPLSDAAPVGEVEPLLKPPKKRISTSITPLSDASPVGELEPLLKPPKKRISTFITPLRHPGFSFSVIHLLSAVRVALITPYSGDNDLIDGNGVKEGNERQIHPMDIDRENHEGSLRLQNCERGTIVSDEPVQKNLSSLTINEIVYRVRYTPGDPRILETKMPLQDLVRGVLKIFTSKTAPPGATYWKPLTAYDKTSKTWSWIGPVPSSLSHTFNIEEEIFPTAWGVSRRIISKLVDSYAQWIEEGQEVLEKIGNLPPPPQTLMQCASFEERLNDRRKMRSLVTLSPSSEEVKAYFRLEESLRYSYPDRAFQFTALDGRKSTVAPLRRCSGKPTARIRDHFILKQDRPPQFTVLCLVRDAAARLPSSFGSRLDICTLVRDSQFILGDACDMQISQVVSGALDRLHYEDDPCIRYDRIYRFWAYMHGDKEEEDFDQNCTSSRKTRKRYTAKLAKKISGSGQGSMQGN